MKQELLEVEFNGRLHEQTNCVCDCCHGTGRVAMIQIPKTKYRKEDAYRMLSTRYKEYWLCEDCHNALLTLLMSLKEKRYDADTM